MATTYSIGFGIGLLGVSYAICALIPGLFIKERQYDAKAIDPLATAQPSKPVGEQRVPVPQG